MSQLSFDFFILFINSLSLGEKSRLRILFLSKIGHLVTLHDVKSLLVLQSNHSLFKIFPWCSRFYSTVKKTSVTQDSLQSFLSNKRLLFNLKLGIGFQSRVLNKGSGFKVGFN